MQLRFSLIELKYHYGGKNLNTIMAEKTVRLSTVTMINHSINHFGKVSSSIKNITYPVN